MAAQFALVSHAVFAAVPIGRARHLAVRKARRISGPEMPAEVRLLGHIPAPTKS
jgi:hypothetical protein